MRTIFAVVLSFIFLVLVVTGCDVFKNPVGTDKTEMPVTGQKTAGGEYQPPVGLVTAAGMEFWPYTGSDFSGTPVDPINLIFRGQADPRAIRAALMFLDGDRTDFGFPDAFPFNLSWADAAGTPQTTYGSQSGWVGSAIQMELGDYQSLRFHLRLFDIGEATLGGAHLDLLISGTTEHESISWETPQQLLTVDLVRSGLLVAPPELTEPITDAPTYRTIQAPVFSAMPMELWPLIPVTTPPGPGDVPIPNDGQATILVLGSAPDGIPQVATQEFTINFDQVIPKPFCASPSHAYLYVQGPVTLRQRVIFTPSGNFISNFKAEGRLSLTPLDSYGQPSGGSYQAIVKENHKGIITDNQTLVSNFQMQVEIPPRGLFRGKLLVNLIVGPGNSSDYDISVDCNP